MASRKGSVNACCFCLTSFISPGSSASIFLWGTVLYPLLVHVAGLSHPWLLQCLVNQSISISVIVKHACSTED